MLGGIPCLECGAGLSGASWLDPGRGALAGRSGVSDAELDDVNMHGKDFHPEWNYVIAPRG